MSQDERGTQVGRGAQGRPGGSGGDPRLELRWWPGPQDGYRHGPEDDYVFECWVGTLGPTATLAWRQLVRRLQTTGPGELDLADLALSLGLGARLGRSGPLWRALGRLVRFGAARFVGEVLEVRPRLADLPARTLARSARSARARHQASLAARGTPSSARGPMEPVPVAALQARALALQGRVLGAAGVSRRPGAVDHPSSENAGPRRGEGADRLRPRVAPPDDPG